MKTTYVGFDKAGGEDFTLYELFLRQPEGGYRRFVRWDSRGNWIPTDEYHPRPPYWVMVV